MRDDFRTAYRELRARLARTPMDPAAVGGTLPLGGLHLTVGRDNGRRSLEITRLQRDAAALRSELHADHATCLFKAARARRMALDCGEKSRPLMYAAGRRHLAHARHARETLTTLTEA